MSRFEIRPFESQDDFEACVDLQEEVWGSGFSERVPVAILKVSLRLGGVAAGAWDEEGELAGFVFGMTGVENGDLVHWSDMLAVRPALRDSGLGTRLKAYQRGVLLERGIGRAYWTFDPLESRNAYVNFAKLGVVSREYVEDMYGETDSPLHRGIGTDRLVALWRVDTDRVRARLEDGEPPPTLEEVGGSPAFAVETRPELPVPDTSGAGWPGNGAVLIPIPARIQELKSRSVELASRWRRATRKAFRACLDREYEVRELLRGPGPDLSTYLLEPR